MWLFELVVCVSGGVWDGICEWWTTYQIMQRSLRRGSPAGVSDMMTVYIIVVPYGQ